MMMGIKNSMFVKWLSFYKVRLIRERRHVLVYTLRFQFVQVFGYTFTSFVFWIEAFVFLLAQKCVCGCCIMLEVALYQL